MAEPLKAYLINFRSPPRAIGPVTAKEARGAAANIILYLRPPDPVAEAGDVQVFEECVHGWDNPGPKKFGILEDL